MGSLDMVIFVHLFTQPPRVARGNEGSGGKVEMERRRADARPGTNAIEVIIKLDPYPHNSQDPMRHDVMTWLNSWGRRDMALGCSTFSSPLCG